MERPEEDEESNHEVQGPRVPARPDEPGEAERQEHYDSGHARYRSWCAHCLAGRGRGQPHVSAGEGELPEIGLDYFYMATRD